MRAIASVSLSRIALAHLLVVVFFHHVIQEGSPFEAYCILHNRRPSKRDSGLRVPERMHSQAGKSRRWLESQTSPHGVQDIVMCNDLL